VGLDVHKDTIVIAVADEARQREDGHAASMARNAVEGAGSGCPSGGRRDAHQGREGDEARSAEMA
jgi:hypothetical protein